MKIKIKHIIIDRAEGLTAECGPRQWDTFEQANNCLRRMADTAPKNGAYDKTDFMVVYENGEEYEGRIDLQHPSTEPTETVEAHMRWFLEFYGGTMPFDKLPAHVTREKYIELLECYGAASILEKANFRKNYQIGDE